MKANLCLRLAFVICLATFTTGFIHSQSSSSCTTFNEMADPVPHSPADWSKIKPGLHASLVSINEKFPKSTPPQVTIQKSQTLIGWKGERVSAQLLLWTTNKASKVSCKFSDFKSKTASALPSSIAEARFVRYVMTDIFEPGCGFRKPEDFPASLVPDMLDPLPCIDIEAASVRPVWITISIPSQAKAGQYTSQLTLFSENGTENTFDIEVNVQNRLLPSPADWPFHLDLWQHPAAIARAENVPVWSNAHFQHLEKYMTFLAGAGQKVITATLNKDPWNQQTYDLYADMISWTQNEDGTWTYDYTIFDRWVEMMMRIGINKMINCYSMVSWNNEIHYKDARTGKMMDVKVEPETVAFETYWKPFLMDFKKHLAAKGWLPITNIAMDERGPEAMKATMDFLQKTAPELGVSLADNHKSYKQYPYIKDMSVSADAKVDREDIEYRRKNQLTTTFYVCCSDKFPNVFTFSESAEAVYCGWYAMAAGYDGFLRWAFNSWVENPMHDSRFKTWPAGDTYLIYPQVRSSIRFERLVEGLQDVEKVRLLRKELEESGTEKSLKKLEKLNNEVAAFNTITPSKPTSTLIDQGKKLINEISE